MREIRGAEIYKYKLGSYERALDHMSYIWGQTRYKLRGVVLEPVWRLDNITRYDYQYDAVGVKLLDMN